MAAVVSFLLVGTLLVLGCRQFGLSWLASSVITAIAFLLFGGTLMPRVPRARSIDNE